MKRMPSLEIIGHTRQRAALKSLVHENRLPSAMIFAGAAGIGKGLVARELITTLFCTKKEGYGGCGECRGCRQFQTNTHPDFYKVECSVKDEAAVEQWRELLRALALKPFEGGVKIILINDAELISIQAANTLLKTLEEPSNNTYFILVCANPRKLPATIRSRCQRWFFSSLSEDEFSEVIKQKPQLLQNFELQSLTELSKFCDGSLSNIAQLVENQEYWKSLLRELGRVRSGDITAGLNLAKELSKDKDSLRTRLSLLRIAARSALKEAVSTGDLNLQRRTSDLLSNLILAEVFIFEKNLNSGYVLSNIFTAFSAKGENGVWKYRNPSRIEEMIIGF